MVFYTLRTFDDVPIGHVTNMAGALGRYNVSIFGPIFVIPLFKNVPLLFFNIVVEQVLLKNVDATS